jgi:predicted O-methyltransferase YrrM
MYFRLKSKLQGKIRSLNRRAHKIISNNFQSFAITPSEQEQNYFQIGLSRTEGLVKLNKVLSDCLETNYSEHNGMHSEHLVLLAALSLEFTEFKNILEIGTYDGQTALILSKIFPSCQIKTIDLPDSDPQFMSTYKRDTSSRSFVKNRKNLISHLQNVDFEPLNSINLIRSDKKFDLIWIDGAHGYPTVAIDIVNAVRNISKGGIIMVDDIWTNIKRSDKNYRSIAGYETLCALQESKVILDFNLIPKRLSGMYNLPNETKYIALLKN